MSVSTCVVSGKLVDPTGTAVVGATIAASLTVPYFYTDGSLIIPYQVSTTTASDGTWSLTLAETTTTSTSIEVSIYLPNGSGGTVRRNYTIIVPNSGTANFATLAAGQ